MTDLDADLYGDLYGNDDSAAAPSFDASAEYEIKTTSSPTTTTITPTESMPIQSIPSYTSTPQPIATVITTNAQTQPIQTYAENGNTSKGVAASGEYGSAERSIRPSEMKDEGKMFIGGLNWDTTDEGLRNYFTQFGKVDACTIMRDAAGRSRCFAFLTFEDPASVNAVMAQEHVLDGKVIDPKRAIPRLEHQRATKLFIGGLPGSVTSESMREFFSQFGKVIDSTVMLDRETGRSKGFGFISFEDTDVRPFLGFGNLEIDGKLIDVKLAQPRYQREADPESAYGGAPAAGQPAGGGASGATGGGAVGGFTGGAAAGGAPVTGGAAAGAGGTFDPQALAQLYTRMFQMTGGGGMSMNPMMMNPMMMGNMMGGMGMGRGGVMGAGGAGGVASAGAAGMGGGGGGMGRGGGQNIPKGPRGASNPTGAGGGVQRSQRGGHSYHPYAR